MPAELKSFFTWLIVNTRDWRHLLVVFFSICGHFQFYTRSENKQCCKNRSSSMDGSGLYFHHPPPCHRLFSRSCFVILWMQVSCTITFDPETEEQHLPRALDYFQYQLKGVSFLPRMSYGAFPQVREYIPQHRYCHPLSPSLRVVPIKMQPSLICTTNTISFTKLSVF